MALFGRHKKSAPADERVTPEVLVQAAASLGLQQAPDAGIRDFPSDQIKRASRVLHGFAPEPSSTLHGGAIPNMFYNDVFAGTIDGRAIKVANVRTPMESMSLEYMAKVQSTSLVTVELSTLVPYAVEPRLRHQVIHGFEMATGDAEFDAAFRVVGLFAMGESPFSPEARRLIEAHRDWIFLFDGPLLMSVGLPAFTTGDDLTTRVREVVGVVNAFPASAGTIDHSVDDLLTRIGQLNSVEEAMTFLQALSPSDRERLAKSPTPLAKFADVQTPDEITQRFMSLDMNERMQVLAMFEKTQ
ncbi:MAG TPA: hypothetical protein VMK16_08900 [Acidimicrobiales bacterium]|nr:hypothetical protein [Acidimicrobiales bacterium]